MTTFIVTTTADSGAGSLRAAITSANSNVSTNDKIVFDAALKGATITLSNQSLKIGSDMHINGDIDGDGKADITISGNNATRIIDVNSISTNAADVKLSNLVLTAGSSDEGAGIYSKSGNAAANITIVNTTVSDCTALYGGGALYFYRGKTVIANSLITGNHSGYYGTIRNNSNMTIVNSTIAGNTAGVSSAGILNENGKLTLLNSTVVNNHADGNTTGAAIASQGTLVIKNTVVAGNTADTTNTPSDIAGTVDRADHSFFGTNVTITTDTGSIVNGGNPLLGPLADNGGPVLTYAPRSGSPLINAGSNAALPTDTLDLDGDGNVTEVLPIDASGGPRLQGGTVDIGAVELGEIKVTTAADTVRANDGVVSLREAVALANSVGGAQVISFDSSLAGATIVLTKGQLGLTNSVTIDGDMNGDNKADITVSGNNASRVFNISHSASVSLLSLTITNGNSGGSYGGAINHTSKGSLTIIDSTIQNSTAGAGGSGLQISNGSLHMLNSLVTGNHGSGFGGGVYGFNSTISIVNSTIHGNQTNDLGGGIVLVGSSLEAFSSTITANQGNGGGIALFAGGTARLYNSIVAGNLDVAGTVANDVFGEISLGLGNVFGTSPTVLKGSINLFNVTDLDLGELLDNGGSVLTRSPLDGSVLLEAGLNGRLPLDIYDLDGDGNVSERLPLDGREIIRIFGTRTDAGAVEHILNETILGTAAGNTIFGGRGVDRLFGLDGADTLSGGSGNDRLIGGNGIDIVSGGAGADKFVLTPNTSNADVITDFSAKNDTLVISAAEFGGGLVAGILNESQFVKNSTGQAQDADDRFIYDTVEHQLIFDSNGNGAGGSSLVATISNSPILTFADFLIV